MNIDALIIKYDRLVANNNDDDIAEAINLLKTMRRVINRVNKGYYTESTANKLVETLDLIQENIFLKKEFMTIGQEDKSSQLYNSRLPDFTKENGGVTAAVSRDVKVENDVNDKSRSFK